MIINCIDGKKIKRVKYIEGKPFEMVGWRMVRFIPIHTDLKSNGGENKCQAEIEQVET